MEQTTVNTLITENMKKIFAFCLSRVNSRADAEDLANDIIIELLRSYKNIRDDNAFYGFMWSVANNLYKRYLRKNKKQTTSFDEYYMGSTNNTPEDIYVDKEDIHMLRRELALLSKEYREATILYYIKNKSCSEISDILNISNEMVKYYLFKARKFMKEGICMSREFGEKSYNPDIFSMDYWGSGPNNVYWEVFKKRLPGNILLAAYYEPLSVTELSMELGVSAPYLEDEIDVLLEHDLIKLTGNGKYQTNIIIFTPEYENEVYNATKSAYAPSAESLYNFISGKENEIREIGFIGSDFSKNRLCWATAILTLMHAYNLIEQEDFPLLSNGSHGYIVGYNRNYDTHKFYGIDHGITENITAPHITLINHKILNNAITSHLYHKYYHTLEGLITNSPAAELESISDLIRNGLIVSENDELKMNFPVYTLAQFEKLLDIMQPEINKIIDMMNKVNDIGTKILSSHAPKALKDKCKPIIIAFKGQDTTANIIESMCDQNLIYIPKQTEIVSIYGVTN